MATLQQAPAAETISVENPATGAVVGEVPILSAEQVKALAERGRAAQPAWEALGFDGRGRVLRRAQKWVLDNQQRLIDTIVSETGKTHEDALLGEIGYVGNAFGFWAKHAPEYLADEKVRSANPFVLGRKLVVRYAPLGLVGVIGPWNYPLSNSFGDCIPALAAGNAVILKPSEVTPLTSLLMAEAMRECGLPDGVYQVATGLGETGQALIDEVDMVMFTGSTATGKKVMKRAADTLTPVGLELGGKDPMIVDAGVDPEWAAGEAASGAFANAGQVCTSVERIYVHRDVAEPFIEALTRCAEATEIGPLIDEDQRDWVHNHVEDACHNGAELRTGGRVPEGPGCFYPPTVLVGPPGDAPVLAQETFGPVAAVCVVDSFDAAIAEANSGEYGLAAVVLTPSQLNAQRAWRELEVGTVKVNAVFGGAPGGAAEPRRLSGRGFGYGPELLDEVTHTKVVHLATAPPAS
jgi:acyl-CoA reductase-like NAD-dependent aldehyde dehydrogenase